MEQDIIKKIEEIQKRASNLDSDFELAAMGVYKAFENLGYIRGYKDALLAMIQELSAMDKQA